MSDLGRNLIPVEMTVLELLFVTLDLVIKTLDPVADTRGIGDHARDLQDVITSYWRAVDRANEDDELPF